MLTQKEKYDLYIQSKEWVERRRLYFSRNPKICRACGTKKLIHLHHHTYVRMGKEKDSDLVPLCLDCHVQVHSIHNKDRKQNLSKVTFDYIDLIKGVPPEPKKSNNNKKKRKKKKPKYSLSAEVKAQRDKAVAEHKLEAKNKEQKICIYCLNKRRGSNHWVFTSSRHGYIHVHCKNKILREAKQLNDQSIN